MNARQIISNLLKHPYPHDLMRIRAQVVDDFAGDEARAKAELEVYCTEDYALGCRQAWQHAQTGARAYLETPESAPNAWQLITTFNLDTLVPCIVWGVLEHENEPASHEAYTLLRRPGQLVFKSVREEMLWRTEEVPNTPYTRRLDITSVTHWMPMPPAPFPAAEPIYATTSATSWHTQPPVNPVNQVNPVQTAPETFEAHGHTWTRHTPGDPCPVSPDTLVYVLTSRQGPTDGVPVPAERIGWAVTNNGYGRGEIIGWRYATPPAQESPRDTRDDHQPWTEPDRSGGGGHTTEEIRRAAGEVW